MALLNWGKKYSEIKNQYVGITSGDNYVKLLFTNEDKGENKGDTGHIITHGIDYTPDYTVNNRGFVPYCTADSPALSLLFGDATWRKIATTDLPMVAANMIDTADIYTDANLFSSASVIKLLKELRTDTENKLSDALKANDAMHFMGGVSMPSGALLFDKLTNDYKLQAGDTFRATADFTIGSGNAAVDVESGDLLVFSGSDDTEIANANDPNQWVVVEGNIKGTATHSVNGLGYTVAADSDANFTIYAPTTAGTKGGILYSTGAAPDWAVPTTSAIAIINKDAVPDFVELENNTEKFLNSSGAFVDQSTITAGNLYGADKTTSYNAKTLLSEFAFTTTDGSVTGLSVKVGDESKDVAFSGQLFNLTAAKVQNSLTANAATGISFKEGDSYDGSIARELQLSTASNTQLGVVKVDISDTDGKGVGSYDKKSTVSMDNGLLYLTKANVCAALGFEPGNLDQTFTYKLFVSSDSTTKEESATLTDAENPYINFTSTHQDGDTGVLTTKVDDFIQFVGTNAISVKGAQDAITIDAPHAYTGVQIKELKNSAISTLSSASADDTVLKLLAGDGIKLAQSGNSITVNTNLVSGDSKRLVLDTNDTDGTITITSILRDIKINGVSVDTDTNTNTSLNFVSSSDILVATTSVEDDTNTSDEIGFCIAWYNIEEAEKNPTNPAAGIEYVSPSSQQGVTA